MELESEHVNLKLFAGPISKSPTYGNIYQISDVPVVFIILRSPNRYSDN